MSAPTAVSGLNHSIYVNICIIISVLILSISDFILNERLEFLRDDHSEILFKEFLSHSILGQSHNKPYYSNAPILWVTIAFMLFIIPFFTVLISGIIIKLLIFTSLLFENIFLTKDIYGIAITAKGDSIRAMEIFMHLFYIALFVVFSLYKLFTSNRKTD